MPGFFVFWAGFSSPLDESPTRAELDDNGYLPAGIHPATLDEIAARFGEESELRRVQMDSLRYYSPEQADGEAHLVTYRADIYSLGATFDEMLCGKTSVTDMPASWLPSCEKSSRSSKRSKRRSCRNRRRRLMPLPSQLPLRPRPARWLLA